MANVELLVVGGNNAICSGASVTLECTLMGNTLTWNTPEGDFTFIRGREAAPFPSFYYGQLMELNATLLRSTLSFTFTAEVTFNCSSDISDSSTTVVLEGMNPLKKVRSIYSIDIINRSPECTRSVTDRPGQDQETEQDSLLSVCGVEHS